jgi:putative hydrolase of the HAD superfamily
MIFFDIDGTLVDHRGAERAAALAFQRDRAAVFPEAPEDFVARWHRLAEKHVRRYLSGETSFQGQRRARMRELFEEEAELNDAAADELFGAYLERYEENWALYPDVPPCLRGFRGHNLGVISNGDSGQQRRKLETLRIADCFSTVVVSGDIAVSKPAAGIFAEACRAAGRQPGECVYVGDDYACDAEGSRNAGLHAVWLNRDGATSEAAVTVIPSLAELSTRIESPDRKRHWLLHSGAAGGRC